MLTSPLREGTSLYGETFEHFIILECIKLASYHQLDYKFFYLITAGDVEIDLIVERPGKPHLFIEITSSKQVRSEQLTNLQKLASDSGDALAICLSQDPYVKVIGTATVYPWLEGLNKFFKPIE